MLAVKAHGVHEYSDVAKQVVFGRKGGREHYDNTQKLAIAYTEVQYIVCPTLILCASTIRALCKRSGDLCFAQDNP